MYSPNHRAYLNTNYPIVLNSSIISIHPIHFPNSPQFYDNTFLLLSDYIDNRVEKTEIDQSVAEHFLFLRKSTITSFFMVNMIDMPVCFKKSKSLYSKTFEIQTLKFTNMIMRAGLRAKAVKGVTLGFTKCFHNIIKTYSYDLDGFVNWRFLHTFLQSTCLNTESQFSSNFLKPYTEFSLDFYGRTLINSDGWLDNKSLDLKNLLFERLLKQAPLFSFYIRRVDKSIRKNSRGKSGKYTIIWKYVPVYKRLYVTSRWLLKDLKFQKFKTFNERLIKTLETFLLTPDLSFVCRLRRFTHTFVFQNYKKSLLKTLKSTS